MKDNTNDPDPQGKEQEMTESSARLWRRVVLVAITAIGGIAFAPLEAEAGCQDCWRCCPLFNPCATNCWNYEPGWNPSPDCTKVTSKLEDCGAVNNRCTGSIPCTPPGPGPHLDLQAGGLEAAVELPGWFETRDGSPPNGIAVSFH